MNSFLDGHTFELTMTDRSNAPENCRIVKPQPYNVYTYIVYSISLCIPSRVVIQPNNSTQKRKHFSYFNSYQNNLYVELTFPIMCPQTTISSNATQNHQAKEAEKKTFILS